MKQKYCTKINDKYALALMNSMNIRHKILILINNEIHF